MRKSQIPILALLLALTAAVTSARAQDHVLPDGQPVKVAWDAPESGADAVTAYRFETFRETNTGVAITTTNVPATSLTAELPATAMPVDGRWLLAVRAVYQDVNGQPYVSARSNALPFVRPGAPTNLRLAPAP
jgi:hypothetical protein